uniref:Uncharacterized protein n=1 Tax=Escherichia coli TaxID=562 RepID=Q8KTV2_ECOLX|nr:unknown [Escherichia coli]
MTNQVMRIVSWLTTTRTRLCLYPARVFLINPTATFRPPHERFRRLRINGDTDNRFFLWWILLLVDVKWQRNIFCALLQYADGCLFSRYDVTLTGLRSGFFPLVIPSNDALLPQVRASTT